MHPLQVLGFEGMWGTLGVGLIGLPLAWLLPGSDVGVIPNLPTLKLMKGLSTSVNITVGKAPHKRLCACHHSRQHCWLPEDLLQPKQGF